VDRTPFLHSHPFHYVSIILKGGYTEQVLNPDEKISEVKNGIGTFILRKANRFHRIKTLHGKSCVTLFFAFQTPGWDLKRHPEITCDGYFEHPDGMYQKQQMFQKRFDGKWFIPNPDRVIAENETRLSIHQNIAPDHINLI
jgi:hypothetical protein